MVKQSKGTTATRAKAGGKKAVETPVQGFPEAQARPLTVETPILIPVNEPGP